MFYAPYFDGQYFSPVWFAPGDEAVAPPAEIREDFGGTALGATMIPRRRRRTREILKKPFAPPQHEEADALMLCGCL